MSWPGLLRVFLFLFAFTLEVRVRASENIRLPLAEKPLQQPSGCLKTDTASSAPCAIRAPTGERFLLQLPEAEVALDSGAMIVRISPTELRLVEGTVWIKSEVPLALKTEFGEIALNSRGEFWASRTTDRVAVSVVKAAVELRPRGAKAGEVIEIPAGWENWLGRIGTDGVAQSGVPIAIPLKAHLTRMARLYPKSKRQFEIDAEEFQPVWEKASKEASEIHQTLHDRKVASIEQDKARKARAAQKVEARNKELRDLLKRRALLSE